MDANSKLQIKVKKYREEKQSLWGSNNKALRVLLSLQHDLVAKEAKKKLAYITLIEMKQSHIKEDQIFKIHWNMKKSRELKRALETIFIEKE